MIAVSGVSMRFGSKVLFDDVSTTFSNGRRYGLTGPERGRQVHLHETAHGRAAAAEGHGHATRPARRPAPGSVRLRPVPGHRHGDHGQCPAVGGAPGTRRALRPAVAQRRRRHAARRARGHHRRARRLLGRERRGGAAGRARHRRRAARAEDVRAAGRPEGARAAGPGAFRPSRGAAPRRAHQLRWTSTRSTGCASSWCATTARWWSSRTTAIS